MALVTSCYGLAHVLVDVILRVDGRQASAFYMSYVILFFIDKSLYEAVEVLSLCHNS